MYKFKLISLTLTDEDEARERSAIKGAKEFMKSYGKGQEPYMVDLRHYSNSWHERVKSSIP